MALALSFRKVFPPDKHTTGERQTSDKKVNAIALGA
jgi:hypothetical protein